MGLIRTALIFGIGYAVGSPEGRRRLGELGGRARDLASRPEVTQLRERGWNVVSSKLKIAKPTRGPQVVEGEETVARYGWRPRPFARRETAPSATTPAASPADAATPTGAGAAPQAGVADGERGLDEEQGAGTGSTIASPGGQSPGTEPTS